MADQSHLFRIAFLPAPFTYASGILEGIVLTAPGAQDDPPALSGFGGDRFEGA
jgi:hypothetical protein